MKSYKSILLVVFMLMTTGILFSCKKRTDDVGGKGGAATVRVIPQHHGRNIDSCTIYIKYNTSDLPSSFDDSAVCKPSNGNPVATFGSLKKGKYYLYGKGWDPQIQGAVAGGKPYTISQENDQTVYLPVTEGD